MRLINTYFIPLLLLLSCFFHLYNLAWGQPYFFHPDERNIASSVSQLNFPKQLNPHFFAYGSLPIYAIYFTGYIFNTFYQPENGLFNQAIIISRFYSSLLSVLLVFSVYFVTSRLTEKKTALLATFLTTTSVGLLQFAHFGTFEIWLTIGSWWLFYLCTLLAKTYKPKYVLWISFFFGSLLAIKISSGILLLLPAIALVFLFRMKKHSFSFQHIFIIKGRLFFLSFLVFLLFSPFILIDTQSFLSTLHYESSVAFGTLHVFYTGEFFNSIPVLFQLIKIYPFLINPFLTILLVPSFLYLCFISIKNSNYSYSLLLITFLLLFLSQSFLFAKWIRYIVPTIPFAYLIISITIIDFLQYLKRKYVIYFLFLSLATIQIIFFLSFFITTYIESDTRIQASIFAKNNIPASSSILSEVYDLGIVPFNQYFQHITLFNFYDLDNNPSDQNVSSLIKESSYIILPSQRIFGTRLINKSTFPNGNDFYTKLFNGKLGYKMIYQTPCSIFCKIAYLNNPLFSFEQTTSVFDRPTLFIFKKI